MYTLHINTTICSHGPNFVYVCKKNCVLMVGKKTQIYSIK